MNGAHYRVTIESEYNLEDYPALKERLDNEDVETRDFFTMNGALYIRHGDLIFKVGAHKDRQWHWNEIKEKINGNAS